MGASFILLPLLLQGALCQLFTKQPEPMNVVRQGDSVTLECMAPAERIKLCAWKITDSDLGIDGFLTNLIPPTVDITARNPSGSEDCSITLNNVDRRYDGRYICAPYLTSGSQENAQTAQVMIAQKPVSVSFAGVLEGRAELAPTVDEPSTVTCEARDARPAPAIAWYLDNTQLYDNIEATETNTDGSQLVSVSSKLTRIFTKEENGRNLRCVASHAGFKEGDVAEAALVLNVQYAPYRLKGSSVGTLYGFTEGQEGRVIINFTANPAPFLMMWKTGEDASQTVPSGGQSLDGRFTANELELVNKDQNLYALTLTIDPVRMEDQLTNFRLELENMVGQAVLDFNLGTGPAPPPAGLSSVAIAIIIIAIILLALVIITAAFARSRGKWCFAVPPTEGAAEALVAKKKKETDLELAENKEETRELTKSADNNLEATPEKKEGEVVYAELVLNSEGVKTEVRPSSDKTEYAVIVGTQQGEGEVGEQKNEEEEEEKKE